jgi:glycosyltransferase involved in cell wall biosynthesis
MSRYLMFAYWGRHGALTQLTQELAKTIRKIGRDREFTVSISTTNELFDSYEKFGELMFPIKTFRSPVFAFSPIGMRRFRNEFRAKAIADGTRALVSLMPHVWTPTIIPVTQDLGIRHTIVVHDASPHSGDPTASVSPWLLRAIRKADQLVTLSEHVARELCIQHKIPREKIAVLFHPDLSYGSGLNPHESNSDHLRLLFFGRMLNYKGLDLFLDALSILHELSVPLKVSVVGPGNFTHSQTKRMQELSVDVTNRWTSGKEIADIFAQHDIAVLTHLAASQSGVIPTAYGSGLPVLAVPVGGLVDQIEEGVTGIITKERSAEAIASAIKRIAEDRSILNKLRNGVAQQKQLRSMERFLNALSEIALRDVTIS